MNTSQVLGINNFSLAVYNANSFFLRLRGLIGIDLGSEQGILITPCNQVHTFFMKYPIDVIFLSPLDCVLYIEHQMKPNKISKKTKYATKVLELKGGQSEKLNIKIGDIFSN